ncbi:hypothetical protein HHI36_012899 [Cryptolaemus montrouzieri]|uniref:Uncharacterized protein n=1 Tax=Cryptolaemus montrouzieri TaxID=559131 RepID=A0ABD2NG90_9CUCU
MNHFQLRVSLFEEWPILRKKRGIIPSRRKWVGRDYELLDIIVRIMNATFKVLEPPAETRYIGALKDIREKRVDFCFVRRFRMEDIDGIHLLSTGDLSTLNRNNSKQAFALPFVVIRGMVNPDLYSVTQSANYVILPEPLAYSFAVYMFPDDSPYRGKMLHIYKQKQRTFECIFT